MRGPQGLGRAQGQLCLPLVTLSDDESVSPVVCAPDTMEERPDGPLMPVSCPVGCRGTTGCLCGQGELSDNPVWIERDLSTW